MEKKIKIKIKRMKTTILGCTKTDRFLAKSHKAYLTPIGMTYKSKENAYLQRHLVTFSSDPMYLAGCQINQIYVNFYLHQSLKNFDKNSPDKIWAK